MDMVKDKDERTNYVERGNKRKQNVVQENKSETRKMLATA